MQTRAFCKVLTVPQYSRKKFMASLIKAKSLQHFWFRNLSSNTRSSSVVTSPSYLVVSLRRLRHRRGQSPFPVYFVSLCLCRAISRLCPFVAALSGTSWNFHVHSPEDDSSNYMNLEHDAGILFPVLREVAHVCIARARCTAGVEPNLTFPDWRTVQMESYGGLCVAWITDLVVSEARKNEMKKTIKFDAVHAVCEFLLTPTRC